MSGLLAGKVWQSALDSHLKPLAAVLADIANDDGSSIYPSVAYIAWLLGKGRRSIQVGLSELKALGIIEALGNDKGGRGQTTAYQMIEENLPNRVTWKELRKGAESARFTNLKGASGDTKGRILEHERAHFTTERVQPTAPDPLVDPLVDTSKEPSPIEVVVDFYKTHLNHPRTVLTDERRKLVARRLREYSPDDLCAAIRGCKMSAFHQGENDRATIYDSMELIFKDAQHVESFIQRAEIGSNGNGNGHKPRTQSERNIANLQAGLAIFSGRGGADNSQEPIGLLAADSNAARK
jgi:hypothetical protein